MVLSDWFLKNIAKSAVKNLQYKFTVKQNPLLFYCDGYHSGNRPIDAPQLSLQLSMFVRSAISSIQEHTGKNCTSNYVAQRDRNLIPEQPLINTDVGTQ